MLPEGGGKSLVGVSRVAKEGRGPLFARLVNERRCGSRGVVPATVGGWVLLLATQRFATRWQQQ